MATFMYFVRLLYSFFVIASNASSIPRGKSRLRLKNFSLIYLGKELNGVFEPSAGLDLSRLLSTSSIKPKISSNIPLYKPLFANNDITKKKIVLKPANYFPLTNLDNPETETLTTHFSSLRHFACHKVLGQIYDILASTVNFDSARIIKLFYFTDAQGNSINVERDVTLAPSCFDLRHYTPEHMHNILEAILFNSVRLYDITSDDVLRVLYLKLFRLEHVKARWKSAYNPELNNARGTKIRTVYATQDTLFFGVDRICIDEHGVVVRVSTKAHDKEIDENDALSARYLMHINLKSGDRIQENSPYLTAVELPIDGCICGEHAEWSTFAIQYWMWKRGDLFEAMYQSLGLGRRILDILAQTPSNLRLIRSNMYSSFCISNRINDWINGNLNCEESGNLQHALRAFVSEAVNLGRISLLRSLFNNAHIMEFDVDSGHIMTKFIPEPWVPIQLPPESTIIQFKKREEVKKVQTEANKAYCMLSYNKPVLNVPLKSKFNIQLFTFDLRPVDYKGNDNKLKIVQKHIQSPLDSLYYLLYLYSYYNFMANRGVHNEEGKVESMCFNFFSLQEFDFYEVNECVDIVQKYYFSKEKKNREIETKKEKLDCDNDEPILLTTSSLLRQNDLVALFKKEGANYRVSSVRYKRAMLIYLDMSFLNTPFRDYLVLQIPEG